MSRTPAVAVALAAWCSACAPTYKAPPCDPAPLQAGADGGLEPTGAHVLTTMGRTHDEDPSLLRAKDGSFYLAWLSDRDGNDEIYVMRSLDGITWGVPARATFDANPDWYPTLLQGRDDRFYLVWFRAQRTSPARHVMFNSSDDGLTWNFAQERELTTGDVDDWCPTMLQTSSDDLLVYFSRQKGTTSGTMDLFSTRSSDLGQTWTTPSMLASPSDPSQMDNFPFAVERAPGDLAMVWVQHDPSGGSDYFHRTTDLMYSSSADGDAWSNAEAITSDDASGFVDSIPSLYRDQSTPEWFLLWTSTGPSAPATVRISELALSDRGSYPSAAIDASARGLRGYSAHAVATQVPNVYLGVWAQQQDDHPRLCWQAFSR